MEVYSYDSRPITVPKIQIYGRTLRCPYDANSRRPAYSTLFRSLLGSPIFRHISLAIIALIALVSPAAAAAGTAVAAADSATVTVLFRVSESDIDLGFMDNGSRLDSFVTRLKAAQSNPAEHLGRLHIVGYSSPEGGAQLNKRLSRQRAENLRNYLLTYVNIPDSMVTVEAPGIDWAGLDRALGSSQMLGAPHVQYIIRHEPEFTYNSAGRLVRSRKQVLMDLNGGRTWREMLRTIFPQLRSSSASVVCYINQAPAEPVPEIDSTVAAHTLAPEVVEVAEVVIPD